MNKEQIKEKLGALKYKGISIFSKRFDCDWNNRLNFKGYYTPNGCGRCKVCKYLDFLDFASNTAPAGSTIQYDNFIDRYLEL
jgi:hypothetical protein